MNELLQEFVNQSQTRYQEHNIDLEKLTELIVHECAKVAEEVDGDSRARKCVLEHFGFY